MGTKILKKKTYEEHNKKIKIYASDKSCSYVYKNSEKTRS